MHCAAESESMTSILSYLAPSGPRVSLNSRGTGLNKSVSTAECIWDALSWVSWVSHVGKSPDFVVYDLRLFGVFGHHCPSEEYF